jgi:hypothetical protein
VNGQSFDSLARGAASARDRRTSLKLLGAAALATAAAAPMAAEAGKAGKKARKKCKKQGKQCREFIIADCQNFPDVQDCIDRTLPCCDPFARCNAAAGFECFDD